MDSSLRAGTIAIVEDDADIRALLDVELRAAGYTTVFARDGAAAVTLIRDSVPDLILLDLGLPAGDGFTVIDRLEHFPALQGIPIVIITARTEAGSRERALAAGAAAFIEKPFGAAELMQAVERAIASRRPAER